MAIVLSNLNRFKKQEFGGDVESLFLGVAKVLEAYEDEVLEDTLTLYALTADVGYQGILNRAMPSETLQYTLFNDKPTIEKFVRDNAQKITDTTREQVANVINKYRDDFPKMEREIKKTLTQAAQSTASRARRIAITEVNRISNMSSLAGATAAGANKKVWVWSGVERDFHASIQAAGPIDIDKPYVSGQGNRLDYPGDPKAPADEVINCTCGQEFLTE